MALLDQAHQLGNRQHIDPPLYMGVLLHRQGKPQEELRCFVQLSGWFPLCRMAETKPISATTVSSALPAKDSRLGPDLRQQSLELLKSTFGFAGFLPTQWEVIHRVLQPKDTLVVMPTGGGKSLCYQLPALLRPGLTVVISPLVALML